MPNLEAHDVFHLETRISSHVTVPQEGRQHFIPGAITLPAPSHSSADDTIPEHRSERDRGTEVGRPIESTSPPNVEDRGVFDTQLGIQTQLDTEISNSSHAMDQQEDRSDCMLNNYGIDLEDEIARDFSPGCSRHLPTPKPATRSRPDRIPHNDIYDLICIGFGPASLAIAIALHDATSNGEHSWRPNVCFLEKQDTFGWHGGMQIPGAKMQISFLKDLATLRDPTSRFTFLNYLKCKKRLINFANLGTFLPTRLEFEDYLRWCADHFHDQVLYGQTVRAIKPGMSSGIEASNVDLFEVEAVVDQKLVLHRARNVVIAIGGRPNVPQPFPRDHPRIIHSSSYIDSVSRILDIKDAPYEIAIVGSGQSAAEIFVDLQNKYPNSITTMIIRDTALRPSDDSPFVNEVFDFDRVDTFYQSPCNERFQILKSHESTNYGVVRLELLEQIYHNLYQQRVQQPDEHLWRHRICTSRAVTDVRKLNHGKLKLTLQCLSSHSLDKREFIEVDAVVVATGYTRDAHEEMLTRLIPLRPAKAGQWQVGRNYKLELDKDLVSEDAGIWLQGSNESTHGISDTLLSILATRSGEIVESIFGDRLNKVVQKAKTNGTPGSHFSGSTVSSESSVDASTSLHRAPNGSGLYPNGENTPSTESGTATIVHPDRRHHQ